MINETRNELLAILNLEKSGDDNRKFYIDLLLERFEYDIKEQLRDAESKVNQLKGNLETLDYVRKQLSKKESD